MRDEIRQFVLAVLGVEQHSDSPDSVTGRVSLGLDDLTEERFRELVGSVEREYGIALADDPIAYGSLRTVNDLVELVLLRRLAAREPESVE
ncbi:hypothetical protein [Actinoalloteichus caeruleus]|uniref:hypothetical protein n=1 Tax=Actinoalloteichus cyanogriseus TaxID=2893586 RepID=UPI0004AA03D9|nr:hypothetical protein [Actinoalloteichus caeruleus]